VIAKQQAGASRVVGTVCCGSKFCAVERKCWSQSMGTGT